MLKLFALRLIVLLQAATFVYALYHLAGELSLPWAGLAMITLAPLVQLFFKVDSLHVVHHRVRLPGISLFVFVGLGLILVSVDKYSSVIWLAFLNIAAFILDTYWLKD